LRIVEACYAIELPEAEWLSGLCAAARPLLDDGLGVNASTFDFSEFGPGMLSVVTLGMPDALVSATHRVRTSREDMRRLSVGGPRVVSMAQDHPRLLAGASWRELRELCGAVDTLALVGSDASGVGVALGAHRRAVVNLAGRERDQWQRIATHAGAAYRLRRRLAANAALREQTRARVEGRDSLLNADGHIAPTEQAVATIDLRTSALAIDGASQAEPEHSMVHWRELLDGRWSLIDRFEAGGRRFLIAHRGVAQGGLTSRERAVLAYRARGRSLKVIAIDTGRSVSMVARDLERGMQKLGLRGQADLAQLFPSTSAR
jgi:DNA-binding CsgD family transcriptional regulator